MGCRREVSVVETRPLFRDQREDSVRIRIYDLLAPGDLLLTWSLVLLWCETSSVLLATFSVVTATAADCPEGTTWPGKSLAEALRLRSVRRRTTVVAEQELRAPEEDVASQRSDLRRQHDLD